MGQTNEEWRDVAGKPGWRVSNLGRVQSCRKNKGRQVELYSNEYRDVVVARPHLLVWKAFVNASDEKNVILEFIDGDRSNAAVSNLRLKRKPDEARSPIKERVNVDRYRSVMRMFLDGAKIVDIAKSHGISDSAAYSILSPKYRARLRLLSAEEQAQYWHEKHRRSLPK